MRCRHFTIRLSPQHTQQDEAQLNEFLERVQVHTVQTATGAPGCWSVLVFYDGPEPPAAEAPASGPEAQSLTPEEQRVYERLREWRSRRASAEGKPAYVIAHNAVLLQIARGHMSIRAVDDLLAIGQFGPARAARYGPEILALLAGPADEEPLFDEGAR